ncbi:cytochrome b [Porticoccus sp.]
MPLTGYLSSPLTQYKTKVFGTPVPKPGWEDPEINAIFSQIHEGLMWGVLTAIAVHIAGVIFPHVQGDQIIQKMLPWKEQHLTIRY